MFDNHCAGTIQDMGKNDLRGYLKTVNDGADVTFCGRECSAVA